MTIESIEVKIREIDKEIAKLNNEIVQLSSIDKNFSSFRIKSLERKINELINKKYELKELLEWRGILNDNL